MKLSILLFLFALLASCGAATHVSPSLTFADVQSTINGAESGDTVALPAGSGSWASQLVITQAMTISAAGTTITGAVGSSTWLIKYAPTTTQTNVFRLTGLTVNANTNSRCLSLESTLDTPPVARVDRCTFDRTISVSAQFVNVHGVFDHNTINPNGGVWHCDIYGLNTRWVTGSTNNFGTTNCWVMEDNWIQSDDTVNSIGISGKGVWRYNILRQTDGAVQPLFDLHGNQYNGNNSGFGGEYYGNLIYSDAGGGDGGTWMVGQRGGQILSYWNLVHSGRTSTYNYHTLREEYSDNVGYPPSTNLTQTINTSYYWNNATTNGVELVPSVYADENGAVEWGWQAETTYTYRDQRRWTNATVGSEHAWKVWNTGTSGVSEPEWNETAMTITTDGTVEWLWMGTNWSYPLLVADRDFWEYETTFDGTSGVGEGPLASRPATCLPGVGYWATDQSVVSDFAGTNPPTAISGTLYVASGTNQWTAFYTPLTYPHPLVTAQDGGGGSGGALTIYGTLTVGNLVIGNP